MYIYIFINQFYHKTSAPDVEGTNSFY